MNKIFKTSLLAGLFILSLSASAETTREHRSVWATPFLEGNWPSSAITESNANTVKSRLTTRLDVFKTQNINVIYYHCRSMCDATYNSAYEPWAAKIAGTRGGHPAFDPFEFLVEEAHKRGIEVYAWLNPYRYCNASGYGSAAAENDYEKTHPDWLIVQSSQSILNPGLEAVKQRIVDVCKDILVKYDIDGIIFDDYFYTNGTPLSLDATQYNAYKSGGGTMSQQDWRRNNVNEMVRRVSEMIKASSKPYVRFGISPAGVASPPTVTSEYGLNPVSGSSDWQYGGIFSDPLNWLKNGYIDFISPQIYWPEKWNYLVNWWNVAATKFNRHLYPSTDISDLNATSQPAQIFVDELLTARNTIAENQGGAVFFQYSDYVNYSEKYNGGSLTKFADIIKNNVWTTKVLQPIMPWKNSVNPMMVNNVKLNGTTLTWDAISAGRYTVYAVPTSVPDNKFGAQKEYLEGVSYTNSYTIPAEKASGYKFAVAVYDRYGNEYAPLFVGATPTTIQAANLTYPKGGIKPADLFSFTWTGNGSRYTVEISETASFDEVYTSAEVYEPSASVSLFRDLTPGKRYYWRVTSSAANAFDKVSSVENFVASRIAITSPSTGATGVSLTPTLTWSTAVSGAEYNLQISTRADFVTTVYNENLTSTSFNVPALASNTLYYAKVTASLNGASSTSDVATFTTQAVTPSAPTLKNPATNGQVIHCNEAVEINPAAGCTSVTVQISATTSFPTRSIFSQTLTLGTTSTNLLQSIKVASKALSDGTTYYVRAQGTYNDASGKATKTDFSEVRNFTYSAEAGIEDVTADATEISAIYYNLQGVKIDAPISGQVAIKVATMSTGKIKISKIVTK